MSKRLIYLIPLLAGLAIAGAIAAWMHVEQQHFEQKTRLQVFDKLAALQGGLENGLHARLNLMSALRTYVRLHPDLDQDEFAALAGGLFSGSSGVRSVELARNNVISHIYPLRKSGRTVGRALFAGKGAIAELSKRALETSRTQIAVPMRLEEGGEAIVTATPIYLARYNRPYWGMMLMIIDSATLFREAGLSAPHLGLTVALKRTANTPGQYSLLYGDGNVFARSPVLMSIAMPDGPWQLAAVPDEGWVRSPNQSFILFGGGAATLAIVTLIFTTGLLLIGRLNERDTYRHLIQNAKSIILRVNMAGDITFCNEYAAEFYGYEPGELVGKPLVGTLVPLNSLAGESMRHYLNRLFRNPASLPFNETMNVRKSGEAVWVAWAHKPVLSQGQTTEILSVGTDITDRKFMEEALRQRERQYRLLAENVTDVIFGLDADLRYTYVSPSDQMVRGFRRSDVLGLPVTRFLAPLSRDRMEEFMEGFRNTPANSHQSTILDLEFMCEDGNTLWLETRLGPLLNEEGEVIGYQGLGRDISDRKLAEALREDVERMARHDLKTPLGAVIGLPGEIRLQGGLTQTQENMLDTIEKAGESMLRRINHSLDLFKMERGTYVIKRQPVNVLEVLEAIKSETRTLIREKGISLGLELLGPDQEDWTILAEGDLFRSMLSNLLLNALQASPEGGAVTVTMDRRNGLSVTIRNQGEVPVALREIFFEKYATTDNGLGTGLGTYSARLIARTHGGDIRLHTAEPGHTTLCLTLPQ